MAHAPPVSRGGFSFAADCFSVTTSGGNVHRRRTPAELKEHFRSKDDQPAHFYEAQLLHYGLPPSKVKGTAKMRLMEAVMAAKALAVPAPFVALEKEMKKEWAKACKAAASAAKATATTSAPAPAAAGSKKRKAAAAEASTDVQVIAGGSGKISVSVTVNHGAAPKRAKTEPSKKETVKKEPVKKETVKKDTAKKETAKKETAKKEPVKKQAATKEAIKKEPAKKKSAVKETTKKEPVKKEPAKEGPPTKKTPANTPKAPQKVNKRARRTGPPPSSAPVQPYYDEDDGYGYHDSSDHNNDDNDDDDPPPPYPGSPVNDHYGGGSSQHSPPAGRARPPALGYLNGLYTVSCDESPVGYHDDDGEPDDAPAPEMICTIDGDALWVYFSLGFVRGVMRSSGDRPRRASRRPLEFEWYGRSDFYGERFDGSGPARRAHLSFVGGGVVEAEVYWVNGQATTFTAARVEGQSTRSQMSARDMEDAFYGYFNGE